MPCGTPQRFIALVGVAVTVLFAAARAATGAGMITLVRGAATAVRATDALFAFFLSLHDIEHSQTDNQNEYSDDDDILHIPPLTCLPFLSRQMKMIKRIPF